MKCKIFVKKKKKIISSKIEVRSTKFLLKKEIKKQKTKKYKPQIGFAF